MLKIRPILSIEYLTQSASDAGRQTAYYTDTTMEPPGEWWCPGSWIVPDAETASARAVSRLSQGRHPRTGRKIVSGNRMAKRAGFDLTFSAPNAFTGLWAVAGPHDRKQLDEMLMASVRETLDEIFKAGMIEARRGKNGARREPVAAPVAALYRHTTSRDGDPQAHVHAAMLMVGLRQDRSIGAINNEMIMKAQKRLGAAFRLRLAGKLEAVGVPVEADPEHGFMITRQPAALLACWSKRRTAILEEVHRQGMNGTKNHAAAADAIALATRGKKADLPPRHKLEARWRDEAALAGCRPDDEWSRLDRPPIARSLQANQKAGRQAVWEALQQVAQTQSLFDRDDLEYAALTLTVGRSSLASVREAIDALLAGPEIVHINKDGMLTTPEILGQEHGIVRIARQRQAERWCGFSQAAIAAALSDPRYSDEQRQAIRHSLSPAGVTVTQGGPGVGKTTAAFAIAAACRADRRRLILAAPSWTATETLKKELSHRGPALAIDKLLHDINAGKMSLQRGDVVLVDEGGMVGTRQALDLMAAAARVGAALRWQGDRRQIASVSRGDPLGLIERAIGGSQIKSIRRQKVEWQRAASMAAQDGYIAKALGVYHRHGAVTVAQDADAALEVAAQVFRDAEGHIAAVAATNAAVADLNVRLRAEAVAMGLLTGPELTIMAIPRGQKNLKGARPVAVPLRAGDRLLLGAQAEIGGVILRNAAQISVHEIDDSGRIALETGDGRLIFTTAAEIERAGRDGGPATLQHAYAVTTHAAQGATWAKTIWVASHEDTRSALVAMTRHATALNIVIDRTAVPMRDAATVAVGGNGMADPISPVDDRTDAEIVSAVSRSIARAVKARNALDVLAMPPPGRTIPRRRAGQHRATLTPVHPLRRGQRPPVMSREARTIPPASRQAPGAGSPASALMVIGHTDRSIRRQAPDRAARLLAAHPAASVGGTATVSQELEPTPAAPAIEAGTGDHVPAPEI